MAEARGPRLQGGGGPGEAGTQGSAGEGAQRGGAGHLPLGGLQAQGGCLKRWFAGTPPPCPACHPAVANDRPDRPGRRRGSIGGLLVGPACGVA